MIQESLAFFQNVGKGLSLLGSADAGKMHILVLGGCLLVPGLIKKFLDIIPDVLVLPVVIVRRLIEESFNLKLAWIEGKRRVLAEQRALAADLEHRTRAPSVKTIKAKKSLNTNSQPFDKAG